MAWLGMMVGVTCLASLSSCGGGTNGTVAPEVRPSAHKDARLYLAGLGEIYVVDVARRRSRLQRARVFRGT